MRKNQPTDRQKLEACLDAMRMLLHTDEPDVKGVSVFLKHQIGPGWTVVTAAQWLTGKAAWTALEAMGTQSKDAGCSSQEAMGIVAFAAELCHWLNASGGVDMALERLRSTALTRRRQ